MKLFAMLRLWIGTTLALAGAIAVVIKIGSVFKVPSGVESLFDVLKAPGERLITMFGCGAHGGDCFGLPWLLAFCLLSGAAWATILTLVMWALAKLRGK